MSEAHASYVPCKRLVRNDTLRRVVTAGNILAHRLEEFIAECVSLGVPESAAEEMQALRIWEATLAELRGEVGEVQP